MRSLSAFVLLFTCTTAALAQERVRNVRMRVVDSSLLEVRYDLVNARPGDSIYLSVRSRLRGLLRISPEFIRGDVGSRITAGPDRRIIWDAPANGYPLNEEIRATVLVRTGLPPALTPPKPAEPILARPTDTSPAERVAETKPPRPSDEPTTSQPPRPSQPIPDRTDVTEPTSQSRRKQPAQSAEVIPEADRPEEVRSQSTRYSGPAWALLSLVAPGVGNIFVQRPRPRIGFRPLLAVSCYGLVAYGLLERRKAQDTYAVYQQQKNPAAGEPYYQTANDHHHRYYLATRGAIVVAAADVILTFLKGLRNSQGLSQPRRDSGVSLRPGWQANQPTAVVRYCF